MLFAVIAEPVSEQRIQEVSAHVDGFEVRVDLLESLEVIGLIPEGKKILLTYRSKEEGGRGEGIRLHQLAKMKGDYLDVEWRVPDEVRSVLKKELLISYHNFQQTPDLEKVLARMGHGAHYKIAAMAKSVLDALRMLLFMRKHPHVSCISMGEKGEVGRILAPVCGGMFNYAPMPSREPVAPGQLSIEELEKVYHFRTLNEQTKVFGLIGKPVAQSVGPRTHNQVFRAAGIDGVYVKMELEEGELEEFFRLAPKLFSGLSVTMPYKEAVIPYLTRLDHDAERIGAVNTITVTPNGEMIGSNTDGKGAMDALAAHTPIKGARIVILGAGGSARAVAYEAMAQGAEVRIVNRTVEKAKDLARRFGCRGGGVELLEEPYDVIINCTPSGAPIGSIMAGVYAMDIVQRPPKTPFLEMAERCGCPLIYGREMFEAQAIRQRAHWFGD